MWVIPCDNCGEDNRALHITYPNPNPEFCSECQTQKSPRRIEMTFCSWECLIVWTKAFQSSEQKVKTE